MRNISTSFLLALLLLANSFISYGQMGVNTPVVKNKKILFEESFDNTDFSGWSKKVTNANNTWRLGNPKKVGVPPFSAINPESQYSLAVYYDDNIFQDELLTTPSIVIEPNATCSFYACFDGVYTGFLGARFKILAENTATGMVTELFDAGEWSDQNGHERPKWLFFKLDLGTFSGQEVKIQFSYKGIGGDDVLVDDFRIEVGSDDEPVVQAPKARILFPEGGYLSPYAGLFIPADVPVRFRDASLYAPTDWKWQLPGSDTPVSTEQHPEVTYPENGMYDVSLTVYNPQGQDEVIMPQYIQVGGSVEVWNVEIAEASRLTSLALGFYGYYGGTNWLGMKAFAEVFHAPLAKGSISEVSVFFDKVATVSPEAEITVSIHDVVAGLPGKVLGSSVRKAKELQCAPDTWIPTIFYFQTAVAIADSFFVSIAGIPNNEDVETYQADDIAIAAVPVRASGGKSTAYHLLEEWDDNYQPTGELKWVKSEDELTSLAIAPKFTYDVVVNSICAPVKKQENNFCFVAQKRIVFTNPEQVSKIEVYDLLGNRLASGNQAESIASLELQGGVYLVKARIGQQTHTQKIRILTFR